MSNDEVYTRNRAVDYPKIAFVIAFVVSVTISTLLIVKGEKNRLILKRNHASRIASNYVREIQNVVNNNLSVNYSLGMLIYEGGNKRIKNFDDFGKQILKLYPDILNISLAPDGIVQDIYPLRGNEKAIGHDLFNDKERAVECIETKESGLLTVAGPYILRQGGYSILGRLPVMLPDQNGNSEFWGFSTVAILIDDILEAAQIDRLDGQGYEYEIWRISPYTDSKEVISSSELAVSEPEEQKIILPNREWNLGVSPTAGWVDKSKIYAKSVLALIISSFIGVFFWMLVKLKISKRDLEKIAFTDGLTGLTNRRMFFERFRQILEVSKNEGRSLAICYMDLDNLKTINDTLGHQAGDIVLKEISNRYKMIIPKNDTVARLGGDEFAILLSNVKGKEDVVDILEQIQDKTSKPIIFEGVTILPSISIGVTIFPYDNNDANTLLKNADSALL